VDLPADRPLHELGFDSLMATELKNALLADGIDAPLGRLLGGPSVEEIAEMVRPAATADVHGPDAPDASTALWWTHVAAGLVAFALGLLVARC
jgi:hypothetical protein